MALEKYHKALNESITILSFFRLFMRRQYNYVLTSQKGASDWLKISRRFFGLLLFKTEIQSFSLKKRPEM